MRVTLFDACVLVLCALAGIGIFAPTAAAVRVAAANDIAPTWTIALYQPSEVPPDEPSEAPLGSSAPTTESAAWWPTYTIGLFGQLVEVPSLKGKTWDEANVLLSAVNLVAAKTSDIARDDDQVRHQHIAAGKKVAPGTEIRVDLVAKVPNVVGMTLEEAYEILEVENGFKMKYNANWSADYKVTVQEPEGGKIHRRGRDVKVASMVRVPVVIDMTVGQAKDALTDAKLQAVIPTFFEDSDVVLNQSIRGGKDVLALSEIRLTPGVEVPNLIGLGQAQADRLLRRAGLDGNARFRQVATPNAWVHGRTVANQQSIRPGNYVTRDTVVRVTFLRYTYVAPPPPPEPDPGYGGGDPRIAGG